MTINNDVLRERISLLGSFLGDAISRQTGEETLNTIETLRKGLFNNAVSLTKRISDNLSTSSPR